MPLTRLIFSGGSFPSYCNFYEGLKVLSVPDDIDHEDIKPFVNLEELHITTHIRKTSYKFTHGSEQLFFPSLKILEMQNISFFSMRQYQQLTELNVVNMPLDMLYQLKNLISLTFRDREATVTFTSFIKLERLYVEVYKLEGELPSTLRRLCMVGETDRPLLLSKLPNVVSVRWISKSYVTVDTYVPNLESLNCVNLDCPNLSYVPTLRRYTSQSYEDKTAFMIDTKYLDVIYPVITPKSDTANKRKKAITIRFDNRSRDMEEITLTNIHCRELKLHFFKRSSIKRCDLENSNVDMVTSYHHQIDLGNKYELFKTTSGPVQHFRFDCYLYTYINRGLDETAKRKLCF